MSWLWVSGRELMQPDGATPGVIRAGAGPPAGGGREWGRRQRLRGTVGGPGPAPGGGGAAPWAEGKGRRRHLFGQATTAIAHLQAAVETFADFDAAAGIRAAARSGRQGDGPQAELDDVVAGHDPQIAAAEHVGEIAWGPAPHGPGGAGGVCEAGIEVGDERR